MANETTTTAALPGVKLFKLTGRCALVTGGSKGLGLAMAAGLASAGADVMLASRHGAEATAAAERVGWEFGVRAVGCAADVADARQVEEMVRRAEGEMGK